jgi:hypothetical protein
MSRRLLMLLFTCASCFDFDVPDLDHPDFSTGDLAVPANDFAMNDLAMADRVVSPDGLPGNLDLAVASDGPGAICGTASRCPQGSFLCDGFESGIDSRWVMDNFGADTETIDDSHACRGSSALHLQTPPIADGGDFVLATLQTTISLGTAVAIRAFVYPPAPFASQYQTYLELSQNVGPYLGIQLGEVNGNLFVTNGISSSETTSARSLIAERWNCLEIDIDLFAGSGSIRVWLDDVEVTDLAATGPTQASPPLELLTVGSGGHGLPPDLWIDELVIAPGHIGCTN